MADADQIPEARFTSMRQQHAWDLQRLPNIHRSTFAQEAAPKTTALNTPHPALPWDGPAGYNSRYLPAIQPAWRVTEKKQDFVKDGFNASGVRQAKKDNQAAFRAKRAASRKAAEAAEKAARKGGAAAKPKKGGFFGR